LFRFADWFLLRFADRTFLGLLFQEPPRRTRRVRGTDRLPLWAKPAITEAVIEERIKHPSFEDSMPQTPSIGVFGMGNPGIYSLFDIGNFNCTGAPTIPHGAKTPSETSNVLFGQSAASIGKQFITKKSGWFVCRNDLRFSGMQGESPQGEKTRESLPPLIKDSRIVVKQGKIIHVTNVSPGAQDLPAEMVHAVEIQIAEKLAAQIANGQTPTAGQRRKQIVARVMQIDRFLLVGPVNDQIRQPQRGVTGDPAAQIGFEQGLVDCRKIAINIATEDVCEPVPEFFIAIDCPVATLALTVGIAVINEPTLENRLQNPT
jgi:hypothetical protein